VKNIQNIYFPQSIIIDEENEKQIKLLLCNTTRKKIRNRILSYQGEQKKLDDAEGFKIN
jgi:hypothetical protein